MKPIISIIVSLICGWILIFRIKGPSKSKRVLTILALLVIAVTVYLWSILT